MSLSLAWPQPKNISPPRFKFSDKDNDNDKNKTSLKEPRTLPLDHDQNSSLSDEETWENQPNDNGNIDDKDNIDNKDNMDE